MLEMYQDENLFRLSYCGFRNKGFPETFPWLIFNKVQLPVSKFSNRVIASVLNNGRSKNLCCQYVHLPLTFFEVGRKYCYLLRTQVLFSHPVSSTGIQF